ncbi:pilus assembly protein TadG-related protein [Aquisalimonas sp.]|uniref:pilus assembly protein TadG-related protein n=1 Tax=Aquisalimonas sp. TaxID=1872621 RepID=UPI0025BFDFB2|nr:pilus assembly protein TadG-related protein [Aquisalimonas sp.]
MHQNIYQGTGLGARGPRHQRGASLVLMAISLVVLFGFGALALDGANLYVARNELQNAADAAALAGARVLYVDDGSMVNAGANQVAYDTAVSNNSQGTAVEVASVERGHWSFTTQTFTANPSLEPVDLFDVSTAELDMNLDFINAIEVVTERRATPVQAFFGFVLGFTDYTVSARSVAYIGFAGSLRPEDVDQPIGLCKQALTSGGEYDCSVGRFIPSSQSNQTMSETGGWSSFCQEGACQGGTNTSELRPLVCADGNPNEMTFGEPLATLGGQSQATFNDLYDCWVEETGQQGLWNMTLPVIDCPDGNVGPCNDLVGAVNVNIAWIVDQANNIDADAPYQMELPPEDSDGESPGTWSNDSDDGIERWDDFVETFNIRKPDGTLATWDDDPQERGWKQKTIYFLPDCSFSEPIGQTGGENFGVLAQIPVLVD